MRPPRNIGVNRHGENKFVVLAIEIIEMILDTDKETRISYASPSLPRK